MFLTHLIETCLNASGITSIINDHISMTFTHAIILANAFVLIILVSKKKKKIIEEYHRLSNNIELECENLNENDTDLVALSRGAIELYGVFGGMFD